MNYSRLMGPKRLKEFSEMPDPNPPLVAPRLAHNRVLLDNFLSKRGIRSQFPPVEQQLESVVVKPLFPGTYNSCIYRYKGKLLMVSRFHPTNTGATRLVMTELNEDFSVAYNQELSINDENSSHEDAKLFELKGELCMSYVSSTWPTFPASSVKYVTLSKPDHWRTTNPQEYRPSCQQTMEKNWVFFEYEGKLNIIYRQNPELIIFTPEDKREMKSPGLRWPYGEIRGGTMPIPYQGKILRFFHSRLNNEMPPVTWRYYVGAMLMKAEPPFQMLAVSKRPILRGSEIGGEETRVHFKKNVAFPSGAIEHEGGWLVSCGQNDSASLLVKVKEKDLQLE